MANGPRRYGPAGGGWGWGALFIIIILIIIGWGWGWGWSGWGGAGWWGVNNHAASAPAHTSVAKGNGTANGNATGH